MTVGSPTVHGRYRLGRTLGAGGMGRVWLARDEVLDRDVALKEILLPSELLETDRDALHHQTLREARAAARLSHPAVAGVFDAFEEDGRAWIVMEYVPSRSLQEILDDEGPQTPQRTAEIGLEVLAALRAAHAAGVRHRDVKPANVLLGTDGRVVLTDFGVAAVDGESLTTSSGMVVGSPQYMSPERVRDGAASAAADLWSLGATLYAAVEGQPPYARRSVMETITAIATQDPVPARRAGPLAPVLEGLLRRDPAARTDAAETEKRLRAAAEAPALPRQRTAAPVSAPPASATAAAPPVAEGEAASTRTETAATPPAAAPMPVEPVSDDPVPSAGGLAPTAGFTAEPASRSHRPLLIAAAAIVVIALLATAAWFGLRPSSDAGTPDAAPTTNAPAQPTRSPAATTATTESATEPTTAQTATATATAAEVPPAGWRLYRDPTGFALFVPEGWTRSKEGSIVYFRSEGRVLGIDQTDDPHPNPVEDWRGKAEYRESRGDFPSYREIKIVEVDYFREAADWEFTFNRRGTRQHVNNRGFVTADDQAYGIWFQTSDAAWADHRDDLQLIFESFRPADG